MKLTILQLLGICAISIFLSNSYKEDDNYVDLINNGIHNFKKECDLLQLYVKSLDEINSQNKEVILQRLYISRLALKQIDPWLRYFEPVEYKKINGVLPIEWEVESFEKFEIPYQRKGYGLLLIEEYLTEPNPQLDSIDILLTNAIRAVDIFLSDSLQREVKNPMNVVLVNRMFLLNLASIYTTGFECPNKDNILSELIVLLEGMKTILRSYQKNYSNFEELYFDKLDSAVMFVREAKHWNEFNHFLFIRDFVEPLFQLNQKYIQHQKYASIAYNEFSLNNSANSIFDKNLYTAQDLKGVFKPVQDHTVLNQIRELGQKLFYDPLFSGNNKRSCASCHIPTQYFTDTTRKTSKKFDEISFLERNSPTLINFTQNQLIRMDGRHFNFFNQTRDVLTNPDELATTEKDVINKVLTCRDYKKVLKKIVPISTEPNLSFKHISSAISVYLDQFNYSYSCFDSMIMNKVDYQKDVVRGFNLFMGKAQCGTCHFVPSFGGVKPPFLTNEFEVLGVPNNTHYTSISEDKGRYNHFKSKETLHAFRTPVIRNISFTKPYMHNGVFNSLQQVMEFYNNGGGIGHGLNVSNQTLSADTLNLTSNEIESIISFMNSLSENIKINYSITKLPVSKNRKLILRKSGGEY